MASNTVARFNSWKEETSMDIGLFDNFEEDGQLSMFDLGEDIENLSGPIEEAENVGNETGNKTLDTVGTAKTEGAVASGDTVAKEKTVLSMTGGNRIRKCSTCGRLLCVREEAGGYRSVCNTCGISYKVS